MTVSLTVTWSSRDVTPRLSWRPSACVHAGQQTAALWISSSNWFAPPARRPTLPASSSPIHKSWLRFFRWTGNCTLPRPRLGRPAGWLGGRGVTEMAANRLRTTDRPSVRPLQALRGRRLRNSSEKLSFSAPASSCVAVAVAASGWLMRRYCVAAYERLNVD